MRPKNVKVQVSLRKRVGVCPEAKPSQTVRIRVRIPLNSRDVISLTTMQNNYALTMPVSASGYRSDEELIQMDEEDDPYGPYLCAKMNELFPDVLERFGCRWHVKQW
jgi:hypothetical protein